MAWLLPLFFLSLKKANPFEARHGFVLSECARLIDGWLDGTDEHDLYVDVYPLTALARWSYQITVKLTAQRVVLSRRDIIYVMHSAH